MTSNNRYLLGSIAVNSGQSNDVPGKVLDRSPLVVIPGILTMGYDAIAGLLITVLEAGTYDCRAFSMDGTMVAAQTISDKGSFRIPSKYFPKGMYFLRVQSATGTHVKPFYVRW